jgi:hypothetical protein
MPEWGVGEGLVIMYGVRCVGGDKIVVEWNEEL